MWHSSNMFLKKLITNLCLFPRSSTPTSTTTLSSTNNNNKSPSPVPPSSFATHLSRQFSTHADPNKHPSDKMLIESNFNTLDASTSKSTTPDEDDDVIFTSSSNHSDHIHPIPDHNQQQPDFTTAFASNQFFFSSPGHSKSLISNPPPELENIEINNNAGPVLLIAGGVPVPKYSPDPYWDFRKSMQEMVEARSKEVREEEDAEDENWEYMNRLLTCYLTLNPINTHECIVKGIL